MKNDYTQDNETEFESELRRDAICRRCSTPKEEGQLVCWHCWLDEEVGLLNWGGSTEDWLTTMRLYDKRMGLVKSEMMRTSRV